MNKKAIAVLDSIFYHAHSISLHAENGETIRCELDEFEIDEVVRINPRVGIITNMERAGCFENTKPEVKKMMEDYINQQPDFTQQEHQYAGGLGEIHRELALFFKRMFIEKKL